MSAIGDAKAREALHLIHLIHGGEKAGVEKHILTARSEVTEKEGAPRRLSYLGHHENYKTENMVP